MDTESGLVVKVGFMGVFSINVKVVQDIFLLELMIVCLTEKVESDKYKDS